MGVEKKTINTIINPELGSSSVDMLLEVLSERARETPYSICIMDDIGEYSARELFSKIQHYNELFSRLGLSWGQLVCIERSLDFNTVALVLACIQAGIVFVPVDPATPEVRKQRICASAGVSYVFSDNGYHKVGHKVEPNKYTGLAYVLFTSGSTGTPKGVAVPLEGLSNYLAWCKDNYRYDEGDCVFLNTSLAFDLSMTALIGGVLYAPLLKISSKINDINRIINELNKNLVISVLKLTPSHLTMLKHEQDRIQYGCRIETLIIGGEQLTYEHLNWLFDRNMVGCVINEYGPTETVVGCMNYKVTQRGHGIVPIGKGFRGNQIYLLDQDLTPITEPSCRGEIYIGGNQVSLGYLNSARLTAESFIPDFISGRSGGRLYKTGDLAEYDDRGELIYCGRSGKQVKLNGFRIELGDIEASVQECEHISDVVAMVSEDKVPQLVVYAVHDAGHDEVESGLGDWQQLYNDLYQDADPSDFLGWNNSFDGTRIRDFEMEAWVDDVVGKVSAFSPKSCLEIGCGNGNILSRIAPGVDVYVASDISPFALDLVKSRAEKESFQARVRYATGDALTVLINEESGFDAIVASSVVQYFGSKEYLDQVIDLALERLNKGGVLYIGDVRCKELQKIFYYDMASKNSDVDDYVSLTYWKTRFEKELFISPEYFRMIEKRRADLNLRVRILPKYVPYTNELTVYRYDVLLLKSETNNSRGRHHVHWGAGKFDRFSLETLIQKFPDDNITVTGLSCAWLNAVAQSWELIKSTTGNVPSDAEFPHAITAIDPYQLSQSSSSLGREISVELYVGDMVSGCAVSISHPGEWGDEKYRWGLADKSLISIPNQYIHDKYKREKLLPYLKKSLPEYMVPSSIVFLEDIPFNTNGKLDKTKLPKISAFYRHLDVNEKCSEIEKLLIEVMEDVFSITGITKECDFFELGGDSIVSIQIVSKLRQLGYKISVKNLMTHSKVDAIAKLIEPLDNLAGSRDPVKGKHKLLPIQAWFYSQDFLCPEQWNQSFVLTIPRQLSDGCIEDIVARLCEHHDALRLRFFNDHGRVIGHYCERVAPVKVKTIEVCNSELDVLLNNPREIVARVGTSISLEQGGLIDLVRICVDGSLDLLLFSIHHLVMDTISWRILLEDFETLFNNRSVLERISLPEKSSSYQEWGDRLEEYSQSDSVVGQISYWSRPEARVVMPSLGSESPLLEVDESVLIGKSVSECTTLKILTRANSKYQTHIDDLLLVSLLRAFRKWKGVSSLRLDLESHGREEIFGDIDLTRTVGWFTSTYPVVLSVSRAGSISQDIKKIHNELKRVPQKGIGYGLLRYVHPSHEINKALSDLPASEISFNYIGQFDKVLADDSEICIYKELGAVDCLVSEKKTYKLYIEVIKIDSVFNVKVEYAANWFQASEVEQLLELYCNAIEEIAEHCAHASVDQDNGGALIDDMTDDDVNELFELI